MLEARDSDLPTALAVATVLVGLAAMTAAGSGAVPFLGLRGGLLLGQAAMITIVLAAVLAASRNPAGALALHPVAPRSLVFAFGTGLALWLGSAGLLGVQHTVWPPSPEILRIFESLHGQLDLWPPWSGALSLLAIAIGPAVNEELAFRGLLMGALRRRVGDLGAVVVSAGLFSLIHIPPGGYRVPFALGIGLALGALRLRSGSLAPCVVAHAVLNATTVIVTDRLGAQADASATVPVMAAAGLLAVGVALTLLFLRAQPPPPPAREPAVETAHP